MPKAIGRAYPLGVPDPDTASLAPAAHPGSPSLRYPDFDAVLFDAGGVLVLPDPEMIRSRLAHLGVAPDDEACRNAHYAGMRELDRLGEPDWPAVDRVIAGLLGVADEHFEQAVEELEKVYLKDRWVPVAGAAAALAALSEQGITLGVVSNATGTMEQMLLDHRICGVVDDPEPDAEAPLPRVAVIIDSHVVGVEKPDPRIFDIALQAIGLPAESCAFVGDTVHFDVHGARAAGLHPVHLDPYGLCPDDDHDHITALGELAGGSADS
jgi:putative hydrolase of the HAD superfamily